MKTYTYDQIKLALQTDELLRIDFTKVDGTLRTLYGSLHASQIPAENAPKGEKKLKLSEDAVRIYDIENKGWRSFRVDSVTNIFTVIGDEEFPL